MKRSSIIRRYYKQGKDFGWCLALGKSFVLMLGSYGIGWVYHPGPQRRRFELFQVTN